MDMALFGRKKNPDDHADGTPQVELLDSGVVIPRRSVHEQREFLLSQVPPLRPFGMSIWDAVGLTLCEDIASDLNLPLVTTSKAAGFALRASDVVGASPQRPATLFVVDSIAEGDAPGPALPSGAAVEVAEGAIVPEGVDAVVPYSDSQVEGERVHVVAEARLHQFLRIAGSELSEGAELVGEGATLNPRSIATLAEVGYDKVLVRPRPRVVVIAVGDHLVAPGVPLTSPAQRYDASTALLSSYASADKASVFPLGVISAGSLRQTLFDQLTRADLVLVVGGGEAAADAVRELGVLDQADVPINGTDRYGFALLEDRVPTILLPGGVVSACVGYLLFVQPVIARLNDAPIPAAPTTSGRLLEGLDSVEGVTEYVPAVRDASGNVTPVAGRGAELAYDLVRANVLAVIPDFWSDANPGSEVQCLLLTDSDQGE